MEISTPSFQKGTKSQRIQIISTTATVTTTTKVPGAVSTPDTSMPEVQALLTEFLTNAARYFSKGLSLANFMSKATFIWNYDRFINEINSAPANAVVRMTWVPEAVIFHQNAQYESIWQATHLVVEAPAAAPAAETALIEAPDAIPFDETNAIVQPSPRRGEKQKVREARLRAALAHLRAERLALKYYEKYGKIEDSDKDSTLSIESDFEDELEDLGKI
jgi:hypothetical protein